MNIDDKLYDETHDYKGHYPHESILWIVFKFQYEEQKTKRNIID